MGSLVYRQPLAVACPKCGAEPGKRCRTLTTHRSTDTHEDRWYIWEDRGRPSLDTATATNRQGED